MEMVLKILELHLEEYQKSLLWMAAAFLLIILVMILIRLLKPKELYPYRRRDLLTKREAAFYAILRPIVQDYGWELLMKLRLADIVGVAPGQENYMSYFNKIKAKHTDFVICDPQTMEVLLAIELDDPSHEREDRILRDEFVDRVYEAAGIPLLHEWLPQSEKELEAYPAALEKHILDCLGAAVIIEETEDVTEDAPEEKIPPELSGTGEE